MTTSDQDGHALEIPTEGWADRVRTLILGGVGSIPLAGQAASALVEILWKPAYEKRVQTFLEHLVRNLQQLDGRIAALEVLVTRETAVSIGIAGARAAGRTHDETKLRLLANATSRVTLDITWDASFDLAIVLLQFVDDLTVTHIRVLKLVADSEKWASRFSSGNYGQEEILSVLGENFPDVDQFILRTIASDLISKGLVMPQHMFFGGASLSHQGASELGLKLLALIDEFSLDDLAP